MQKDFKITAPVLDMNVIQKAAQDAAMKAALEKPFMMKVSYLVTVVHG